MIACSRNRPRWLSSPSSTLSGSGSWDVRAHRLSTRAWRTTSSGHIPNKSSPFAKVVTHLLLLVNMCQELGPGAQHAQQPAVLNRGPGQTSRKRLAAERGSRTHRQERLGLLGTAGLAKQLSSESERSRSGSSHSTQSVAMGSDPSPATPDPTAARSAEEATVHIPAPGTPRQRWESC